MAASFDSLFDPVEVLLDCIHNNPYQPRLVMDEARIRNLANSIKEEGLQQFPQAREKPGVMGHYELVFGHRRTAAYRLLRQADPDNSKWHRIPLYVVPAKKFDNQKMFEAAISENSQREDIGPIAKAIALERYIQEFGATQMKAGRLFNLTSQSAVSNLLRLLKLPSEVKDLVEQGIINEYRARNLLRIAPQDALCLAQELAKREPDQRDRYFSFHFPKYLPKVVEDGHQSKRAVMREPALCPTCKKVPGNYTHSEKGWQCGECSALVSISVRISK